MSVHTAVRIDYQPSQSLGVYPTRMTVSDASLGEFRDGLSQNIRLSKLSCDARLDGTQAAQTVSSSSE